MNSVLVILALCGVALAACCALLALQKLRVTRRLRRALRSQDSHTPAKRKLSHSDLVELLLARFNNLQAEVSLLEEQEILSASTPSDSGGSHLSTELKLLQTIRGSFRALVRAIVVVDGPHRVKTYIDGPFGDRFDLVLAAAISHEHHAGNELACRVVEVDTAGAATRALENFDLGSLLICSLGGEIHNAYLVLAYRRACAPLGTELRAAQSYARYAGAVLGSSIEMAELSGKVEQLKEEQQRRSEFLAQISHDIRSPLNNIQSILHLLRIDRSAPDAPEMIDIALKNCRDVADLVQDILDFVRHQAGKLVARRSAVNLVELARDVARSFEVQAKAKQLRIQLDLPDAPANCQVDPRHLRRVLSNLMANALNYTEQGQVAISISCEPLSLCVRDTGVGISDQQLSNLFAPFSAGAQSKGIGLGLALSKALCELNAVELVARSSLGEGSVFELRFNNEASAQVEPQKSSNPLSKAA